MHNRPILPLLQQILKAPGHGYQKDAGCVWYWTPYCIFLNGIFDGFDFLGKYSFCVRQICMNVLPAFWTVPLLTTADTSQNQDVLSWKVRRVRGFRDPVCETKLYFLLLVPKQNPWQHSTWGHTQQISWHCRLVWQRFLCMLLEIKLGKAQPQQAKSYTQSGMTICHRGEILIHILTFSTF